MKLFYLINDIYTEFISIHLDRFCYKYIFQSKILWEGENHNEGIK